MKSVVNGVTVFDTNKVQTGEQNAFVQVDGKIATSVEKNEALVHLIAEAQALVQTPIPSSHYKQVQEVLSAIHLILISYVSKLF